MEHDDLLREYLEEVLTAAAYAVLVATNGSEGLAIASRTAGAIDLLVTDVVLPDLNGSELAARVMGASEAQGPVRVGLPRRRTTARGDH